MEDALTAAEWTASSPHATVVARRPRCRTRRPARGTLAAPTHTMRTRAGHRRGRARCLRQQPEWGHQQRDARRRHEGEIAVGQRAVHEPDRAAQINPVPSYSGAPSSIPGRVSQYTRNSNASTVAAMITAVHARPQEPEFYPPTSRPLSVQPEMPRLRCPNPKHRGGCYPQDRSQRRRLVLVGPFVALALALALAWPCRTVRADASHAARERSQSPFSWRMASAARAGRKDESPAQDHRRRLRAAARARRTRTTLSRLSTTVGIRNPSRCHTGGIATP